MNNFIGFMKKFIFIFNKTSVKIETLLGENPIE